MLKQIYAQILELTEGDGVQYFVLTELHVVIA